MNILSLLNKYDAHPKKRLGQHFLIAVPTLEKIIRELDIKPNDKILEIGPGPGAMTKMLTEKAKFVAAIETDKEMIRILENEWGNISNLHIIHGDALDTDLKKLLEDEKKWLFVGNIPYNITSPILFHLKKFRECFSYGLLTLQKEVAKRLVASPGNKEYGILSVAMQAVSRVEQLFSISAKSFYPEPKVESAVVKISFDDKPEYGIEDIDFFTKVVRAAFSTRRKKLKNALINSHFLDIAPEIIGEAIKKTGIPENGRAEELDIKTLAKLADNLTNYTS